MRKLVLWSGLVAAAAVTAGLVRADGPLPPWIADGEVMPPSWARSVVPKASEGGGPGDMELFVGPSRASGKRGVTAAGASLPFFGAKRGAGCSYPWWLVGPLAWTCADGADLSPAEATAPPRSAGTNGLTATYFFVTSKGADAYDSLEAATDGAPNRELEGGWAVAIVDTRTAPGDAAERWGRTSHDLWIAMRDLEPARPSVFHGEVIHGGRLDFAWVVADRASVWPSPAPKEKPTGERPRFARVTVLDENGSMLRVGDGAWMLARDLARPALVAPPAEVTRSTERWIDVDVPSQTLVAYEGTRPAYATLVSTGRGAAGMSGTTPEGVHRVWVKILGSDMGNATRDDEEHYSLEDVPYVQFFDGAVALHGTYWHGDFGRARSHGCVNLAPIDAQWMFAFTEPHLPSGWVAAYPTALDEGTVVRVR
jgi:hypothetical protein